MARPLLVDVPTGIRGIARKQRKTKWHPCRVAVAVEIAETDAPDSAEALVTAYERSAGGQRWSRFDRGPRKKETVRKATAGHAGALYRPVTGPDGVAATFADLARPAPHWRTAPFRPAAALPAHADLLLTMREISKDVPEWVAASAARTAAGLLLVGESVWRRDIEPVWKVTLREDGAVEISLDRPFYGRVESGIPFPALERPAAEKAAAELAGGAKFKNTGMRIEKADPAFLSETTPTALSRMMGLAFSHARKLIGQECRGKVPDALQARFADFSRAMAPDGSILEASRLLDAIELTAIDFTAHDGPYYDDRPGGRFSLGWQRHAEAAVRLGLLEDRAPAPLPADALAPEDDDALGALGM